MGWIGHGKYDGDGTYTAQLSLVEKAAKKFKFPIFNPAGEELSGDDFWFDSPEPGEPFVHAETAKNVADHLDYVIKKCIESPSRSRATGRPLFKESSALDYMMLGDFFLVHRLPVPESLHKDVLDAVDYLKGEHADDFNDPRERRSVLNRFYKQFDMHASGIKKKLNTAAKKAGRAAPKKAATTTKAKKRPSR